MCSHLLFQCNIMDMAPYYFIFYIVGENVSVYSHQDLIE